MTRSQLTVLIVAIAFIIAIFMLPKVVVKKEADKLTDNKEQAAPTADTASAAADQAHSREIPHDEAVVIDSLRNTFAHLSDKQRKIKAADSLANRFAKVNKYDSAAVYRAKIANLEPTDANKLRAGDAYYEALTFATNQSKAARMADEARALYKQVLDKNPKDADVKVKLAMTYIGTENPMQGITMLREVIGQDPDNELALYNLGILSVQSRQFDKAVKRFERLVQVNPRHLQGYFYLALSYKETGNRDKAIEYFRMVKKLDKDPSVQATADEYLKELKAE